MYYSLICERRCYKKPNTSTCLEYLNQSKSLDLHSLQRYLMWLWRQTPEPPHTLHWYALALPSDVSCTGPSQLLYDHKMHLLLSRLCSHICEAPKSLHFLFSRLLGQMLVPPRSLHRLRRWLKSIYSQVATACLASQLYRLSHITVAARQSVSEKMQHDVSLCIKEVMTVLKISVREVIHVLKINVLKINELKSMY